MRRSPPFFQPSRLFELLLAFFCVGSVGSQASEAASTAATQAGVPVGAFVQTLAALIVVLVFFALAAWLVRRAGIARNLAQSGLLKIIGGLSIGPRERVVLLEVGEQWLIIGIAPGQMRTLHVLPKHSLPEGTAGAAPGFGNLLQQFTRRTPSTPTTPGELPRAK